MARVHVKKALFLLDRVHLFAIQKEGDGSLQQEINVSQICLKALLIRSKKQPSFFFFSSFSVFCNMFMLYWSSRANVFLFHI